MTAVANYSTYSGEYSGRYKRMEAIDFGQVTRHSVGDPTLEKLRTGVLQAPCAKKAEELVAGILLTKASRTDQAQAILDIALSRGDFPHIQLRALSDLAALDTPRARTLIEHIVRQPIDEDREHIRARAYATLVNVSELQEADLTLILRGFSERSRLVQNAIKCAIGYLSEQRLRHLDQSLDQFNPRVAPQVGSLRQLVRDRLSSGARRLPALEPREDQEEPKPPRRKEPGTTSSARPKSGHLERAQRPSVPLKAAAAPRALTPQIEVARTPAPPPQRTSQPIREEPVTTPTNSEATLPARPVEPGAAVSLEALRDIRFRNMTWQELLTERDRLKDPRQLCACMAEMTVRFGKELTRDAASSKLVFVLSHPEPEIKRLAELLVAQLFR